MFLLHLAHPDPVGTPSAHLLSEQINQVIEKWRAENPAPSWCKRVRGIWIQATRYIMTAIDYFIQSIEGLLESGPDKKATVLAALMQVYDAIVPGLLPIWLKPFNSKIKDFIFSVIIALMIDFIVGKYRKNDWKIEPQPVEPQPPVEPAPTPTTA